MCVCWCIGQPTIDRIVKQKCGRQLSQSLDISIVFLFVYICVCVFALPQLYHCQYDCGRGRKRTKKVINVGNDRNLVLSLVCSLHFAIFWMSVIDAKSWVFLFHFGSNNSLNCVHVFFDYKLRRWLTQCLTIISFSLSLSLVLDAWKQKESRSCWK